MSKGKLKNCHTENIIIRDCHPSFSLENVTGSSNYKAIKSCRLLDLAYQLTAMTRRGDCHVRTSSFLAMTIKGLPHLNPLLARRGIVWILCCLFSFNAHSSCTPTTDCASIGYTETSCEGDSLKCPFDISKLYCIPCDSSFQYSCSGDNITGGTGSACGGKYVSCSCTGGATFVNGECFKPNCTVGMIYYSDKSCSTELDNSKTPIGIVVKDNELVVSNYLDDIAWGSYNTNTSLPELTIEQAKADYNGKSNTSILVVEQTAVGLSASASAAIYCNEYAPTGTNSGDWYLPAAGELYNYVYGNYSSKLQPTASKLNWEIAGDFWSSSEYDRNGAWLIASDMDAIQYAPKSVYMSFACFLAID